MNDKFNEQKDVLESLMHEIKLLQQQVSFLIRNEREIGLLDLDVMMNRTHTIYDKLCGINVGKDEDLDMDPEMMKEIFGWDDEEESANFANEESANFANLMEEEEKPENIEEKPENIEEEVEEPEKEQSLEEGGTMDFGFIFKDEEPASEETEPASEEIEPFMEETEPVAEETEPASEETEAVLEEPVEEVEEDNRIEMEEEKEVYTTGDQIEMEIPHYEISEGLFQEPDEEPAPEPAPEPEEEPEQEPEQEPEEEPIPEPEEKPEEQPEPEYAYEPVLFGDMEEKEELGFELDTPETIGEKLQQEEDHSLAAKLQHKPVADLRTAIGINDKFLLVNELFAGNMERYNKSIENLNDLPTLDGAMGYLDELYVVYQWNRNNEAYKKLVDLVHRKFES